MNSETSGRVQGRGWARRVTGAVAAGFLAALLVAPAAAQGAQAATHQPYCGIVWGSLPKSAASTRVSTLTDVRAGRHRCFDRLVLDFSGRAGDYSVRYVNRLVGIGATEPVAVRGGARLAIEFEVPYGEDAPSFFRDYRPSNRRELVRVDGWRTFRQVALVDLHESQATIGLGVRARLPFRVFTLTGPGSGSRLVVDVAHRW
ncbi:MAG TPA: hypothetical protein VFR74_12340 [Jiangellales bacterium]|nr:hypothetical protein [Jiangellales bacterium]